MPGKSLSQLSVKWERRKRASDAYAPSLRSGCTMTLWAAKAMGILFGGVTDEDTNEETLESVFWNDLYIPFLLCAERTWSRLLIFFFSGMDISLLERGNGVAWH